MKDPRLIRKGPLFNRLVRKYIEDVGIRVQREGEFVKIRLVAGGPWFFFLANEFYTAVEEMKKNG